MFAKRPVKLRFGLKSVFILILGIAIGYSLNLQTLQLLTGRASFPASPLPYVIEPPDILRVEISTGSSDEYESSSGEFLVGPDGRINLGTYGSVYVSGMTIGEAREAIKHKLGQHVESPQVNIDVVDYASKTYYIIVQGQGAGDSVVQVRITGNDTALDAIAKVGGIPSPESTDVWISRPASNGVGIEKTIPIEWAKVARGASTLLTNHQLLPGDRLIISQKPTTVASN